VNSAQLSAWVAQNKVAVLGVAGAGAVGLGLQARKKKAAGDTGGIAKDTALTSGAAVAGTVPYDSSASDAYNALMPAIQHLYDLYDQQQGDTGTPIPLPVQDTPVVTAPAPTQLAGAPAGVTTDYVQSSPGVYVQKGPDTYNLGRTNIYGNAIADDAVNQYAGYGPGSVGPGA
jgi:hypothetical protein